jgi:hypothetical protein
MVTGVVFITGVIPIILERTVVFTIVFKAIVTVSFKVAINITFKVITVVASTLGVVIIIIIF